MKKREILFALVSGFILVIVWIGFNIYHAKVASSISETLNMQITPISPAFDMKAIERIKKREKILPIFELQVTPTPSSPSASPSLSPTPSQAVATPSAESDAVATSGGTIAR